jgi:hypothetical protein
MGPLLLRYHSLRLWIEVAEMALGMQSMTATGLNRQLMRLG